MRNNHQAQRSKYKKKLFQFIYDHENWQKIRPSILRMSQRAINTQEIIKSIKQFDFYANTVHKQHSEAKFDYRYLEQLYKKDIPSLFANMATLILEYERKQRLKIPMFYTGQRQQHTFNKKQILLLNSMMAMNLILPQNHSNQKSFRFPYPYTFKYIFSEDEEKTKGVISYLSKQFQQLKNNQQKYQSKKLTLRRLVLNTSFKDALSKFPTRPMTKPFISNDEESIENYFGKMKVDFANKFIGGGALHHGCVQQQIMFLNHPEMYTSVLFCEMMHQNQAIEFVGYQKYFKNEGYGYTLKFDGQQKHQYEYDEEGRAKQYIVAIDALHYPSKKHIKEFDMTQINRQILKAYVGFSESSKQVNQIVTGNWGCGAFNGNISLKFYIQWFAASLAGKKLIYTPFGAGKKLQEYKKLHEKISHLTVQQFYKLLCCSPEQLRKMRDINKFFQQHLKVVASDQLN